MDNKEMVIIENSDGTKMEVELVTYLVSDDHLNTYIVYSKGEKNGPELDEVIYISKVVKDGDILQLEEIADDDEWNNVQRLLKKLANV